MARGKAIHQQPRRSADVSDGEGRLRLLGGTPGRCTGGENRREDFPEETLLIGPQFGEPEAVFEKAGGRSAAALPHNDALARHVAAGCTENDVEQGSHSEPLREEERAATAAEVGGPAVDGGTDTIEATASDRKGCRQSRRGPGVTLEPGAEPITII
jgi:hypothetical protein